MNIVAMIPARGGSKGIMNKNMRMVAGRPLIAYTIAAAQSSRLLSRIIFTTDSVDMQQYALSRGVEAPFLRPPELAADTTCMIDVMTHCVGWLRDEAGFVTDLLVILYPTSPFRTGEEIDVAIDLFLKSDADCLVSVSRQKHHPYWSLNINRSGMLCHYFGKDHIFYRRQDMPVTYEQNGAIYVIPPETIPRLDLRSMTDNTLPFILEGASALNIDDEMDLLLADAIARSRDRYRSKTHFKTAIRSGRAERMTYAL